MSDNKNLHTAKKSKNDEFYTQLTDIENELKYYTEYFENKIIYCNCDDPEKSNFPKYFIDNFEKLKLKKLISSCYCEKGKGKYIIYDTENKDVTVKYLNGNGDFRSEECIEFFERM